MADPSTLAELLEVTAKLSANEFLGQFDCPFLVSSGVLGGRLTQGRAPLQTPVLHLGERVSHSPSAPNPQAGTVFVVRKRTRGAGTDAARVTVGRAGDRDITVREDSVSHHHGYFEREGEVIFFVDEQSRNGTFVNLKRLTPGARTLIHDGDVLSFGRASYQFLGPAALFVELQAFRDGST